MSGLRRREQSAISVLESDFDRVLLLLGSDREFEARLLADPERTLASFHLNPDERAVLAQYQRWRPFS